MRARPILGAVAVAAACTAGELDYTGKSCPCPSTWACVDQKCQRGAGVGGLGDGGVVPNGPGEDGAAATGTYRVSNLRATWATSNTIRWDWDVDGRVDDFGHFELAVAPVSAGAGGAKVWTAEDRPELGRPTLQTRGGGTIRVTSTYTDGLDPDTRYTATLTAFDTTGKTVKVGPAGTTTLVSLSDRLVLFSEARPNGYPLPTVMTIASGCGANGTSQCIRYTPATDPEADCTAFGCGQNLRWQDLGVATTAINRDGFDRAYLELFVRSSAGAPSYYSLLWLYMEPTPAAQCTVIEQCLFELPAWTYKPSTTYRRLQVPLRTLANEPGAVLTYERFAAGVFGFNVHAQWGQSATVEIDEVSIYY